MNSWTDQTSLLFSRQNGEDTRFYKQLYTYIKNKKIEVCKYSNVFRNRSVFWGKSKEKSNYEIAIEFLKE